MINQTPNCVTFKMRLGKQIEIAFGCLFGLLMALFLTWMTLLEKNNWGTPFTLFMVLLIFLLLSGLIILGSTIFRSKLVFSADGVYFQGAFTFNIQASWEEVKGFYESKGEMYLQIEKLNAPNKPQNGIPLSWFSRMRLDSKPYKADTVLDSLFTFAPHLLDASTFDGRFPTSSHLT